MKTSFIHRPVLSALTAFIGVRVSSSLQLLPLLPVLLALVGISLASGCAHQRSLGGVALGAVQEAHIAELVVEGPGSDLDGWVQVDDQLFEVVGNPRDVLLEIAEASPRDPETAYLCLKIALMISYPEERLDSWVR